MTSALWWPDSNFSLAINVIHRIDSDGSCYPISDAATNSEKWVGVSHLAWLVNFQVHVKGFPF